MLLHCILAQVTSIYINLVLGPLIYFYNLLLPSETLLVRASVVILLMLYFLLSVSGVLALEANFLILLLDLYAVVSVTVLLILCFD